MVDAKYVKTQAENLGFSLCGICDAFDFVSEKEQLQEWLKLGYAGEMNYMHNHQDLRTSPQKIVENTKSIVVVAYNYYPQVIQRSDSFTIAKYAYGEDYHFVMKDKLRQLFHQIKLHLPELEGRVFVDSAPVMERQLAQRAGLGWIGKNSLLITPQFGSFVFLGELFLNIPLDHDVPFSKNKCGTCTKCIEVCSSKAIVQSGVIDARKCISYLTIEKRTPLDENEKQMLTDHLYGCDDCQDVCPWNKKLLPHQEPLFNPHSALLMNSKEDWLQLSGEKFSAIFKHSAVKRIKYEGLRKNLGL